MEAADDKWHANADEAAPLTVRKGGRSHRDVTHWFANTRFVALRLISWSAPPWGSDWFWNWEIPYLDVVVVPKLGNDKQLSTHW